MSSARARDPFRTLGLRRGAAAKDVKRAYAKRLKNKRPDDDPAAFIALREAFEAARSIAENDARIADARAADGADTEAEDWADDDVAAEAELVVEQGRSAATQNVARSAEDTSETAALDAERKRERDAEQRARAAERVRPKHLLAMQRRFGEWCGTNGATDPEALFSDLAWHATAAEARVFRRDVLEAIDEDTGWLDEQPEWDAAPGPWNERPAPERPEWLSDDAILALHDHFAPHLAAESTNEDELPWVVRRVNMWTEVAGPVLLGAGRIDAPLPRGDFNASLISWIERRNADEHGSYFDHNTREWVDMAPVPRAVREIGALLEAGPGEGRTDAIAAILDRDELSKLDAYQDIERRLRQWLYGKTSGEWLKEKGRPRLLVMHWLDRDVIDLLDRRFGWRDHFGGSYEGQQFDHLHRLIDRVRGTKTGTASPVGSAAWTGLPDRFEPTPARPEGMPVWMTAPALLGGYFVLRFVSMPGGWW